MEQVVIIGSGCAGWTADQVTGVRLKNLLTKKISTLDCAGVFVAIGHIPNTQIFKGQLEANDTGYTSLREGSRTNVPGNFAAGDCADSVYFQANTAAGIGRAAAMGAERFLSAKPNPKTVNLQ